MQERYAQVVFPRKRISTIVCVCVCVCVLTWTNKTISSNSLITHTSTKMSHMEPKFWSWTVVKLWKCQMSYVQLHARRWSINICSCAKKKSVSPSAALRYSRFQMYGKPLRKSHSKVWTTPPLMDQQQHGWNDHWQPRESRIGEKMVHWSQ